MGILSTNIANILVTFVCSNAQLTDCQIYKSEWQTEEDCAVAAIEVGNRARIMQLKETVLFYCTTPDGLEDLPVGGNVLDY